MFQGRLAVHFREAYHLCRPFFLRKKIQGLVPTKAKDKQANQQLALAMGSATE